MMRLLTRVLAAATLAALAATAPAQTAQFTVFGNGCAEPNSQPPQIPAIGNQGLPQLGARFSITYTGPNHTTDFTQSSIQPFLMIGFAPQNLPIPQLFFNQPSNCVLWVTADFVLPMAPNAQFTAFEDSVAIDVPSNPALAGGSLFAQWFALHEQCGFVGCDFDYVLTSDAANILIGL